jgi:hypothetical protein
MVLCRWLADIDLLKRNKMGKIRYLFGHKYYNNFGSLFSAPLARPPFHRHILHYTFGNCVYSEKSKEYINIRKFLGQNEFRD